MKHSEAGKLGYLKSKVTRKRKYNDRVDAYNKNPKVCKACKCPLLYSKRQNTFCGHSCSASFSNPRRANNRFAKRSFTCDFCGRVVKDKKGGKYCSVKCCGKHRWKNRKDEITTANKIVSKHVGMAKRYLVETRGYKCEICNLFEWLGQKLPLVLDHIDGNSRDWSLGNLRLICSNCDSLTLTYKGKNRGNGRHSRRQRYKEGKSY